MCDPQIPAPSDPLITPMSSGGSVIDDGFGPPPKWSWWSFALIWLLLGGLGLFVLISLIVR